MVWHLTSISSDALTGVVEGGSGSGDNSPDWRIHSFEVLENTDPLQTRPQTPGPPGGVIWEMSDGEEVDWTDNGVNKKVRKVLVLQGHAPDNPSSNQNDIEYGASANCDVSIRVSEWAQISDIVNGQPANWVFMTSAEWSRWDDNPNNPSIHETTATLQKEVISTTGVVRELSHTTHGGNDTTKSKSGIAIELTWNGDQLKIKFQADSIGVDENTFDLETIWGIKNFS